VKCRLCTAFLSCCTAIFAAILKQQIIKNDGSDMTQINTYLTFNGNCREAMTFYQSCLGGELMLQTIGESPLADRMPPQMKQSVLHSTLVKDALVLMASDMTAEQGLRRGNAVSLMLNCSSEEEARTFYTKLSEGGQATHPLETTFWDALFGDLVDKFGNPWLIHYDKNQQHS
jgi:PhnB protein